MNHGADKSIFSEPLKELISTVSAWRKLQVLVEELGKDNPLLGFLFFALMKKAKYETVKELEQDEKKIEEIKEVKE